MSKTIIFGHRNPDTDSVLSAIVMADFMKKTTDEEVEAAYIEKLNKETEYVLNYFNIEKPKMINSIEGIKNVILVDHNEFSQSIEGIENVNIERVIDHHRIKDFVTAGPLYYRAEPVGCTGTVLYKMYKEHNIEIDKTIASLIISSIISDTLLFKSPTCTKIDIDVANELAKIADLDLSTYGIEMLKAGTDLSSYSAEELLDLDAKETMLNDLKAIIAQVNTADIADVMKRKVDLEKAMEKKIEEKNLDILFFAITDVINSNSQAIVLGRKVDVAEKAYGKKLEDNTMFLEGIVSRKKQMVPILSENA